MEEGSAAVALKASRLPMSMYKIFTWKCCVKL